MTTCSASGSRVISVRTSPTSWVTWRRTGPAASGPAAAPQRRRSASPPDDGPRRAGAAVEAGQAGQVGEPADHETTTATPVASAIPLRASSPTSAVVWRASASTSGMVRVGRRSAIAVSASAGDRLELRALVVEDVLGDLVGGAGAAHDEEDEAPRRRWRRRTTSTGASRRRARRGRRRAPRAPTAPRSPAAANAEPMPSSTRWASSGDRSPVADADARAVAGVDERAEQGDADGAAELAHGVVERRGDALLLVRAATR